MTVAEPTNIHVLVVDDDQSFVELIAQRLELELGSDYTKLNIHTETDPDTALESLDTQIDCIVSDYQMPDMDGLEFLEAVREEYPYLPFILFTGKGSEEIASEAISAGVTDYLQKSSDTSQ